MAHHLGRPAHPHPAPAVTLLQEAVDPLRRAAFLEPRRLRRGQWQLVPAARVRIDDGHMAQTPAERVDLRRVIRAVHQVVEGGHALRAQLRQRDGHLRIMHAGTGQHRAHGEVPVHGV